MTSAVSFLSVILGSSWAAGLNLYLTVAGLGVAHRMDWIALPGDLEVIAHPIVIMLAVLLYAVEFVADKVPYVDSAWDSVHTFIRPAGGIAMAYMAGSELEPVMQTSLALASGALTLESHTAKATSRAAINTSPEPITNSVASVSEDAIVVGLLWLLLITLFGRFSFLLCWSLSQCG